MVLEMPFFPPYNGHENNQIYVQDFLTKTKTYASLILNPNRETKKTRIRTKHVQDKNPTRFYCKNKTKIKQGCDQKNVPKTSVGQTKNN
jgi:hypothetical protein